MTPSINYQLADIKEKFEEARPLMQEHNLEVGLPKTLEIRKEDYFEAQDYGHIKLFTASVGDKIVGYGLFAIDDHIHHKSLLCAKQTALFIKKIYRGNGIAFVKYCEKELKNMGIHYIQQSTTVKHDWSLVLIRLGYSKLEEIYIKEL